VSLSLVFEGGSTLDPQGREGLAGLLADTLERGPRGMSFVDFSRAFERLGSHFSSEAGSELSTMHATFLARHAAAGIERIADLLHDPGLRDEDLEVVRALARTDLQARQEDLDDLAEDLFLEAIALDHPYAKLPHGRRAGIDAVTTQDLRAGYERAFRPDRGHLAIVGDFDEQVILPLLERRFATLPNGKDAPAPVPPLAPTRESRSVLRRFLEKGQVKIIVGGSGLSAKDPDRHSVIAWNHVLGSSSIRSRLGDEIRDRMGLAYSVSSRVMERKAGGFFLVHMGTRPENARRAIEAIRFELNRAAQGVGEEELNDAKSYLTGSFPLRFTTYGRLARFWSRSSFYEWPDNYLDTYVARVNALTRGDLSRAASRIVPFARVLCACGPLPANLDA
ncbi:MAG TPA: pitrilysin family protein, partial [bacterium]|nr:pitrilysin family protein [bacterium]